ncbi:MAG: hypothetical protein NTZ59_11750 [Bacteroidetes bacterium]|jgi:hypothetical protein|nr:hypothetical protein [Bacteroidota bacterium]
MSRHDTLIGIGSGLTGGVIKYAAIAEVQVSFNHKLFESVLIAFLCGIAGMIGKELFNWGKKRIAKKRSKNVGET